MSLKYPSPPVRRYAELYQIVSRLKIPVHWRASKMSNPQGPEGRLIKLRQSVTALFKYERLELDYYLAEEARGYAERLISDAIRYGPESHSMMHMADWWLEEKQLVHKLFKVLVPRYQHFPASFTTLYQAPYWRFSDGFHPELDTKMGDYEINELNLKHGLVVLKKGLLELKGNPYPPMFPSKYSNRHFIHNVLLSSAKTYFKNHPSHGLKSNFSEEAQKLEMESKQENTTTNTDDTLAERDSVENQSSKSSDFSSNVEPKK